MVIPLVIVDPGRADEVVCTDLTGFDAIESISIDSSQDRVYCAYDRIVPGSSPSSPAKHKVFYSTNAFIPGIGTPTFNEVSNLQSDEACEPQVIFSKDVHGPGHFRRPHFFFKVTRPYESGSLPSLEKEIYHLSIMDGVPTMNCISGVGCWYPSSQSAYLIQEDNACFSPGLCFVGPNLHILGDNTFGWNVYLNQSYSFLVYGQEQSELQEKSQWCGTHNLIPMNMRNQYWSLSPSFAFAYNQPLPANPTITPCDLRYDFCDPTPTPTPKPAEFGIPHVVFSTSLGQDDVSRLYHGSQPFPSAKKIVFPDQGINHFSPQLIYLPSDNPPDPDQLICIFLRATNKNATTCSIGYVYSEDYGQSWKKPSNTLAFVVAENVESSPAPQLTLMRDTSGTLRPFVTYVVKEPSTDSYRLWRAYFNGSEWNYSEVDDPFPKFTSLSLTTTESTYLPRIAYTVQNSSNPDLFMARLAYYTSNLMSGGGSFVYPLYESQAVNRLEIDFSGDGLADRIYILPERLAFFRRTGDEFIEIPSVDIPGIKAMMEADINGDTLPDLVAVDNGKVYILPHAGADGYKVSQILKYVDLSAFTTGDFNDDGLADLVLVHDTDISKICFNNGKGGFEETDQSLSLSFTPTRIRLHRNDQFSHDIEFYGESDTPLKTLYNYGGGIFEERPPVILHEPCFPRIMESILEYRGDTILDFQCQQLQAQNIAGINVEIGSLTVNSDCDLIIGTRSAIRTDGGPNLPGNHLEILAAGTVLLRGQITANGGTDLTGYACDGGTIYIEADRIEIERDALIQAACFASDSQAGSIKLVAPLIINKGTIDCSSYGNSSDTIGSSAGLIQIDTGDGVLYNYGRIIAADQGSLMGEGGTIQIISGSKVVNAGEILADTAGDSTASDVPSAGMVSITVADGNLINTGIISSSNLVGTDGLGGTVSLSTEVGSVISTGQIKADSMGETIEGQGSRAGDVIVDAGQKIDVSGEIYARSDEGNDPDGNGTITFVSQEVDTTGALIDPPLPLSTPTPGPEPDAVDIYVCGMTGSDANGNGSTSMPWQTIAHATDSVTGTITHPVIIHVSAGTYLEDTVYLGDFESLQGDDATTCRLESDSWFTVSCGIRSDVTGMTIVNHTGVAIKAGTGSIQGTIIECSHTGIQCTSNHAPLIEYNSIILQGNATGIECKQSARPLIQNNRISGIGMVGILLTGSSSPNLYNNLISGSFDAAVRNQSEKSITAEFHTIINSGGDGIHHSGLKNIDLRNSIIVDCAGYGIKCSTNSSATIEYSNMFNNSAGNYSGCIAGTGCISANPEFTVGPSGNHYLTHNPMISPCVDAGDPNAIPFGTTHPQAIPDATPVDMGHHYDIE